MSARLPHPRALRPLRPLRPLRLLPHQSYPHQSHPRHLHSTRSLHADPQRQQITITPATPYKKWSNLTAAQKASRTASTGVNFITIIAGMAITGAIFTLLYLEVFAPDSATNWFNTIHARVRADSQCTALLGERIKAYGEPTSNRWSRNRRIASKTWKDKYGVEHLMLHFNVEGHIDQGVVHAHLVRRPSQREYEYRYLVVNIAGKSPIYLEKHDNKPEHEGGPKKRLFGVQWSW